MPQAPNYRNLLIQNSSSLRVYQLNAEHGRGDAETQIVRSVNVKVYGSKSVSFDTT